MPVGFFSFPQHPGWFWGPPGLSSVSTGIFFLGNNASGAWSLPASSLRTRGDMSHLHRTCLLKHVDNCTLMWYITLWKRCQDSSVGIVTGYGLDGRILIPGRGKRFLSTPQCPDRLWGPPSLLSNWAGGGGHFLLGKAARAWCWPHTFIYCRGQKLVELYLHSPVRLHGVSFN
jgi:hypothetical protein